MSEALARMAMAASIHGSVSSGDIGLTHGRQLSVMHHSYCTSTRAPQSNCSRCHDSIPLGMVYRSCKRATHLILTESQHHYYYTLPSPILLPRAANPNPPPWAIKSFARVQRIRRLRGASNPAARQWCLGWDCEGFFNELKAGKKKRDTELSYLGSYRRSSDAHKQSSRKSCLPRLPDRSLIEVVLPWEIT